ncbi:MAG TPA: hypothetical protein VM260_24425 [Pirellula sp.]|nr:hypothetical protein [Pirellula sp.]
MTQINTRIVWLLAWCCGAIVFSGCRYSLSTQYGLSEGTDAKVSPASVSLFRNMCNAEGRTTMVVRSLTPRAMNKLGAIVWSPDSFGPHDAETVAWMDRWLASGDRTMVYVGRDFSPTADYWSQSADKFSNSKNSFQDAIAARKEQALESTELDRMRSMLRGKSVTPWCMFDHSQSLEERVDKVKGPWSNGVDASNARFFLRSHPKAYSGDSLVALQKEFDRESEDTSGKPANNSNATEYDFKWQKSDGTMLALIKSLTTSALPEMKNLLTTMDDRPLVAEFNKSEWGKSRVIVLSNSSLISNLSLTNYENLVIAKKLVEKLPKQNIGFLTGKQDPRVRKDGDIEQQKGFEMLTIWPLNVITLHAVFLGMIVLLAVFPIFGRAKQLPVKSTRDFGQHIEAVGGLLYKSQDRFYALETISEYFHHVRQEPTSAWANAEPELQKEPKSPFKP